MCCLESKLVEGYIRIYLNMFWIKTFQYDSRRTTTRVLDEDPNCAKEAPRATPFAGGGGRVARLSTRTLK